MARKTYKQYKEDEFVRLPLLAWILDRSFIYIALALVFILGTTYWISQGLESWGRIKAEPQAESPYMEIEAAASPGGNWGLTLASKAPTGFTEWAVKESSKPEHIVDPLSCPAVGDLASTVLSSRQASGESVNLRVQVYGAGQAPKQFETYKQALNDCYNATVENRDGINVISYPQGFVFTMGDAIVGIQTPRSDMLEQLYSFYRAEVEATLNESLCRQLLVPATDSTRSLFYDPNSYTGYQKDLELQTQVDLSAIPNPTSVSIFEIGNPNAQQPEGPLPSGIGALPQVVQKPSLPASPENVTGFAGKVIYQVVDPEGPGCGWAWSSQAEPITDAKELENEKAELQQAEQERIDTAAEGYVTSKLNWAFSMASVTLDVDRWNSYVNTVNTIHAQWDTLNTERSNFRPIWDEYISNHELWRTFDSRRAQAQEDYNSALAICTTQNQNYQKWLDQYGPDGQPTVTPPPTSTPPPTGTPAPTPTSTPPPVIPPAPERCLNEPTPPSILSEIKGPEPIQPSIPDSITIPDSWPKATR